MPSSSFADAPNLECRGGRLGSSLAAGVIGYYFPPLPPPFAGEQEDPGRRHGPRRHHHGDALLPGARDHPRRAVRREERHL
eukprot:6187273-Pleurochrysis_carterae.AAC.1